LNVVFGLIYIVKLYQECDYLIWQRESGLKGHTKKNYKTSTPPSAPRLKSSP
jgi:hypothetical protein